MILQIPIYLLEYFHLFLLVLRLTDIWKPKNIFEYLQHIHVTPYLHIIINLNQHFFQEEFNRTWLDHYFHHVLVIFVQLFYEFEWKVQYDSDKLNQHLFVFLVSIGVNIEIRIVLITIVSADIQDMEPLIQQVLYFGFVL